MLICKTEKCSQGGRICFGNANLKYDHDISGSQQNTPAPTVKRVLTYCGTVMMDRGHVDRGGVMLLGVSSFFFAYDSKWLRFLWGFSIDFLLSLKQI